jgi:hypothetical protein
MTAHGMKDDEKQSVHAEFDRLVNMTPARLKAWLDSEDSRSVGNDRGRRKVTGSSQPESVGHHMGERILEIRGKWGKSPGTQVQHALVTRTRGTEFRHFLASDSGTVWKSARSARTFAPLTIRGKKRNALTDQDFADMRKVVGYIHRHSAQRPRGTSPTRAGRSH